METDALTTLESVLCSFAGPAASGILILLHGFFPQLAICGFLQGIYNLLPIYPLDGGQILRTIMLSLFDIRFADKIISVVEWTLLILSFMISIYASVILKLGLVPITLWILFLVKYQKIKIPCKAWRHRVQ